MSCIAAFLRTVQAEGARRGHAFDAGKIARGGGVEPIDVARGQLDHKWAHLLDKLRRRDPERLGALSTVRRIQPHPVFRIVPGGVEDWEKGGKGRPKREETG